MEFCRFTILFALLIFGNGLLGQENDIAKNKAILQTQIPDTTRCRIYLDLAELISDEKEWVSYNRKALKLAKAKSAETKGVEKKSYLRMLANALSNEGFLSDEHGDRKSASDYYFKALRIFDDLGEEEGKASVLSNLGVLYTNQQDYKEALDYLKQSLEIKLRYKVAGISRNYLNIGVAYDGLKKADKARVYYQKGLQKAREENSHDDIATALNNLGTWHFYREEYQKAIPFLKEAISECDSISDYAGKAWVMANLASSYTNIGRLDSSYYYLARAEKIAEEFQYPHLVQSIHEKLETNHSLDKNWEKAYRSAKIAAYMRDSLQNSDVQKESLRKKLEYDHELETTTLKLKEEEQEKRNAQQRWFFLVILGLTAVFLLLLYRRLQETRKQKEIINEQKTIVELKNKEVLDSIAYAQHLQQTILPTNDQIANTFKKHLKFYLPKDIVSGDFYWLREVDKGVLFAVGDCTGHGVPGAMVSVVCSNALNQAAQNSSSPKTILEQCNKIVSLQFAKEENEVNDGMDIALIYLDKENQSLTYSGAFSDLLLLRNGECSVYKAARRPVGKYSNEIGFTEQQILIEKGDWVFLMSDGYADQFGGPEGKKYRSANLRLLLESGRSGKDLEELLIAEHSKWKGSREQTDDICIIGFEV